MEAMLRLAYILGKPEQVRSRAPIALRDLHYLLLVGKQAKILREIYGPHCNQIFSAIAWLRTHLDVTVSAEELSRAAHLSESTMYRHFKALTGLSPLQYHKKLRLHEARRLIISEHEQAATAAYKTGYESVSQFSREYKRLFGCSPAKSKTRE